MAQDYAEAAKSFRENLRCIEARGEKNSGEWYFANGLFLLAKGLAIEHEAEEDRRKILCQKLESTEVANR